MEVMSMKGGSPRPSCIVSISIHFFGTLCLLGGTFIVTSRYLAVLTNFRLVVCRRTQVDKLILEEFSWWRRRERIVILKMNGKKVNVTEVSGLIGEAGYRVPGKTIGRINLMLCQ
jgi:uncharacterized membrane protein